jgi:hypothetical protein
VSVGNLKSAPPTARISRYIKWLQTTSADAFLVDERSRGASPHRGLGVAREDYDGGSASLGEVAMWTVCEPRRYWQTINMLALAVASIQQLQAQMTLDGSVGPDIAGSSITSAADHAGGGSITIHGREVRLTDGALLSAKGGQRQRGGSAHGASQRLAHYHVGTERHGQGRQYLH